MQYEITGKVQVLPRLLGSRKHYSCSRCCSNKHASNDKACHTLRKKCKKCTLTGHFAPPCKTKFSRIEAELAKSAATTSKNPRQCNNIQAEFSNEENSESSQIYSVASVKKKIYININMLKCNLTVCLLRC